MSSRRQTAAQSKAGTQAQAPAQTPLLGDRLLDAAATAVALHGPARTTMDDVARAAGCARQSVYKHFATKDELLTALFAREVERYLLALEHMLAERGRHDASDLEEAFAYTLGYLRGHPLVGRILADPQGMLSVLALGDGSVLEAVTRGIGRVLGALADDRALRAVDGVLVGEIFVRLIASFLLLPRLALDPEDDEAVRALFRECVVEGLRSPRVRRSAKRNA